MCEKPRPGTGADSLCTLHLTLRQAPAYRAAAFDPDMACAYNIFFAADLELPPAAGMEALTQA